MGGWKMVRGAVEMSRWQKLRLWLGSENGRYVGIAPKNVSISVFQKLN
jgi:hypothetical protein